MNVVDSVKMDIIPRLTSARIKGAVPRSEREARWGTAIGPSGPPTAFDHINWIGTVPELSASGTSFMTLPKLPPARVIGMSPISSLGRSLFTQATLLSSTSASVRASTSS